MLKKETLTMLGIIFVIFMVGFVLRLESTHLSGIPTNEKPFYQDENGNPYMYEPDSYYNYRLTRNYLDHGYLGDAMLDGNEWDLHSYYPPGVPLDYPPLIVYITAFFYKLVNVFAEVPLLAVCFWLPAFFGPLCGIPAYLFVRRFTNDYGGLVAGILAVTFPLYFVRTVPGWFDTDMFNVLFPILVLWFFFESIYAEGTKKCIYFAIFSAFSMFLFSLAWNGWQYTFYMIVLFCIFYLIWCRLKGRNIGNLYYTLVAFFSGTIILIYIFSGYLNILKLFFSPFEFLKVGSGQNIWSPWPDIYTSVSELGQPSVKEIVSSGGASLGLGIFSILALFVILKKEHLHEVYLNKMDWFLYSFLVVWILVGFITLIKGARFIIMLIPPLVISSGIIVGAGVKGLKASKRKKSLVKIFSLAAIIVFTLPPILNAYAVSNLLPLENDNLWNSAEWIHNNTQNDTVVVLAEWSYGHFFTAIADRPVLLDGRLAYIET
ncbi:MAG: peptide transporter, partial [Euryarchaeota archaeon]|nr:peptide transporter [Euryarchaeota archaeon]